jgi:hypothetical protein
MQETIIPLCFYGINQRKRDLAIFMNNLKEKESRALQQRLVEVKKYKKFSEFCKEILCGMLAPARPRTAGGCRRAVRKGGGRFSLWR